MLEGPPASWPEAWLYRYWERLSIMEDSNVADAEEKAAADIRRIAEREGGQQMRLV